MAEILGKDLDNWDNSLATREPYNLSDSSETTPQFMTGADFARSSKISSEWKMPVAIPAQANRDMYIAGEIATSIGSSLRNVIADYVPNLENLAAQYAIEMVEGKKEPESVATKLIKGTEIGGLQYDLARIMGLAMVGADSIINRKEYEEKVKTYNDAVNLVNNREYPLTKYARRVLAETTNDVETRRVVRELYNQSQGIDSSKWYNQAGSIIGAMTPTLVAARGAGATARAFGATRLGAINAAQNVAKGFVAGQMAGEYAEETAAKYLERTGDKTFKDFTAQDANGLSAMAYGAIGAQIEFIGGVEPIMAGALSKVGLKSSLLKAGAKIGVGEATEEFLQGITETLMRKIDGTSDKTWKEGFKDAINGAVWGLFIGGSMGTAAFYTNRRNLVKGIKTAIPNISDTQAKLVADAMIDSVAETSSQDPTLRNSLRQKVAMMYETSDIDNKEDRIDSITDLEYSLIAADSAERGIKIEDNPLFKGEVNELGWFREGIPANRRTEIQGYIKELNDLKDQLKKLNQAEQKDWQKIDEIENKLDQFNRYVLDKLSDLARADARQVAKMLNDAERKFVSREKKKAGVGVKVPTDLPMFQQTAYAAMKGELQGGALDFDKFLGKGEKTSAWFGGNYLLFDKDIDKAHYFDKFWNYGPDLMYDGKIVDSADFFNKLGINDAETREIIAHSKDILDTKERVIKDLERRLKMDKRDYDKEVQHVVDDYKNALGEKKVREIISDIEKIILGRGISVGPAANFNEKDHPEEYKIQKKYRNKDGELDVDFVNIYVDLVNTFAKGTDFGNLYIDKLVDLYRKEKSLEVVKKLDWSKFEGRTGLTYQGKSAEMVLDQMISKITGGFTSTGQGWFGDAGEIETKIIKTVQNALALNKDIKEELKTLEPEFQRIVDVLPTLERELKDLIKKAAPRHPNADAKLVEKKLMEFASGLNSVDYNSFMDFREKNNMDISDPNFLLADEVAFSPYNHTLYPEDIVDPDVKYKAMLDLMYAVRSANTKLTVLKETEKEFSNIDDFVYKPKASMYSFSVPDNDVLLAAGKTLNKQPKKVQKSLINFINDNLQRMPFLSYYIDNKIATDEILWLAGIDDGQGAIDIALMKDMQNNMMKSPYFSGNYNAIARSMESFLSNATRLAIQEKGKKTTVGDLINKLDELIEVAKPSENAPNSFHEEYEDKKTMVDVLKRKTLEKHNKEETLSDLIYIAEPELKPVEAKKFYDDVVNNLVIKPDLIEELKKDKSLDIKERNNPPQIIVSKLLRKYGIEGGRYYGKADKRGVVTFGETPMIERLFQSDQDKTLFATHSVRLDGLKRALQSGGFAMPSLAIEKNFKGVGGYGEIIFVAPGEMAQPSRTTKVYDRDAWTPMINFITYNSKDGFYERVQDILATNGVDPKSASSFVYNIEEKMQEGVPEWNTSAIELYGIAKGYIERGEMDEMRSIIQNNPDIKKDYREWYYDFIFSNMQPRIFRGFTELGNRRYAPATLENIVKELKKQPEHRDFTWQDFYSFSDVARELVTRFKTSKEIKKAEDRIYDYNDISEKTQELSSDYNIVAEEIKKDPDNHNPELSLSMALIEGKGSLPERLEQFDLKSDAESVKKVENIVDRIKKLPTRYFEAKVRKGVKFDEFSAVFVPTGKEYDTAVEELEWQGANVLRYSNREELDSMFKNLLLTDNRIRFQNRVSGGAPSTYRGAYIPQYRFIQRANNMDASTLSHELAHDWFEVNTARYRSGKASKDFMRSWGALEKALGLDNDSSKTDLRKASEAFARAYEGWIMNKSDWEKSLNVEDRDRDEIVKLMKDYQSDLRDIYQDLSNPYFKDTWGRLGELKPELVEWFDKVTNIESLDKLVERGEMTADEAEQEKVNRAIDTVVESTEDAEKEAEYVRALNDTARYEVEGGNKNALQRRIAALAQAIDENNMIIKENYDTRRDMLEVAKQADNFVRTRLDDALKIINGEMAEQEGLFKEDIYTALERLATENGDLGLLDELKNSEIANRLAKELGQRVAGFRNWNGGEVDVVSTIKILDKKYNEALKNKKAKLQLDEATQMFKKAQAEQDKLADKKLEETLKELECK